MRLIAGSIALALLQHLKIASSQQTSTNTNNDLFSIQPTSVPDSQPFAVQIVELATTLLTPSPESHSTSSLSSSASQYSSIHHNDLELRQAVGAAGGTVVAAPSPTQMSPVGTYLLMGSNGVETPVVYTQLFSKVPDQWPSPTAGSIGLGTIQGTVGIVKTQSKRAIVAGPEPTRFNAGGLVQRAGNLVRVRKAAEERMSP